MRTSFLCFFACLLAVAHTVRSQTATEVWASRYNGPWNGEDFATAVAVDGAGNVAVTGLINGYAAPVDYYTAKYAADSGALLWEKRYDFHVNGYDYGYALAVDASGNVIVTGSSDNARFNGDIYTAKYAATDGALIWERRYNGPADSYDRGYSVTVDAAGNVIVTGYSYSTPALDTGDYYTAKYEAADGALLWEMRYNGTGGGNDIAYGVAVDFAGNVAVTGRSPNDAGNDDIYTAKYAAGDGALLWEKRYNGPANGNDSGNSVAVDGAGNVVVTGISNSANSTPDYYTAKYAAADGTLLWERRYDGPGNRYDNGNSVAVDASGNVFVTGRSNGATLSNDYYTAKYAAGDGTVLWERRFGAPNYYESAYSVATDAAGNAVVTGHTFNGNEDDYYTVKYAAADGAVLWEARSVGSPNTNSFIDWGVPYTGKLAITKDGGAVVTGHSYNGSNWDYATVRYAPPAGDLDGDGLQDWWETMWWGTTTGHAALDDLDCDGLPDLVELAFGLNPKMSDRAALPPVVNEGGYLTITISKRVGVAYEVQTAGDVDTAAFTPATTTVLVDNGTTLKVRDNITISAATSRYLRVKVAAAP
jgi:hypothetical protein